MLPILDAVGYPATELFNYFVAHRKELEDRYVMAGGTRHDAERMWAWQIRRVLDGRDPMPSSHKSESDRRNPPTAR